MTAVPLEPRHRRPRRMRHEDLRRAQMIAATVESIAEVGFNATTGALIAARAGVSTGLVACYFADTDGPL